MEFRIGSPQTPQEKRSERIGPAGEYASLAGQERFCGQQAQCGPSVLEVVVTCGCIPTTESRNLANSLEPGRGRVTSLALGVEGTMKDFLPGRLKNFYM